MDSFEHFLITRFAVRFVPEQEPPPEDWLRYRLGLFLATCLPSVSAQEGARFRWLLLLDAAYRSGWLEDELDALNSDELFEIVWLEGTFHQTIGAIVTDRTTAAHAITTRLDRDDAIARDYLARVQAAFAAQDAQFVNFQRGVAAPGCRAVRRRAPGGGAAVLDRRRPRREHQQRDPSSGPSSPP
jgi:hypothetical protein